MTEAHLTFDVILHPHLGTLGNYTVGTLTVPLHLNADRDIDSDDLARTLAVVLGRMNTDDTEVLFHGA